MRVEPLSAALGGRISDIDLGQPLGDNERSELAKHFAQYQVLAFENQMLTPADLLRIAGYFGNVAQYPFGANLDGFEGVTEVIKREDDLINFGGVWHSDTTYTENPPVASMLYSRMTPDVGGDTIFANMYSAWETLSSGMQQLLTPLAGVNTSALRSSSENDIRSQYKRSMAVENTESDTLTAVHSVARLHPVTGRSALYVNSAHTKCLNGMTEAESAPILKYLCQHARRPEFCHRLKWAPDMLVLWDNRCTQHYAVNDYHGHRRVMHRVTIAA